MTHTAVRHLIRQILREDKVDFGGPNTWDDPQVAYKDSDPNVQESTKQFALLMDKVCDLLGLPEPIITSGLRPPDRQVKAMLNLWKGHGSEYVIDLYTNKCKSCSDDAGKVAKQLVDLWDKNKRMIIGGVPEAIVKQSMEILEKNPLSAHQSGGALDYGTKTNLGGSIKQALDYISDNGYANFELIDETQGPGPHWHVSVTDVTRAGKEFLQTPNSGLKNVQEVVRRMLREAAGPEKTAALVNELLRINSALKRVGASIKVGVRLSRGYVDFVALDRVTNEVELGLDSSWNPSAFNSFVPTKISSRSSDEDHSKHEEYMEIVGLIPWGRVRYTTASKQRTGRCLNSGIVASTEAASGWGPLLYDIAIESAQLSGLSGLTPDRETVSPSARRVWSAYRDKRADVRKTRLDIDLASTEFEDNHLDHLEWSKLTPGDPSDDCSMTQAYEYNGVEWYNSPLSMVYSKDPVIIPRLESMGLLVSD